MLWLGSSETASGVLHGHVWVADATSFCRLDQSGAQFVTSTTCANLAGAIPSGQPDWDSANNFVFIPTDQGILRFTFTPSPNNPALESLGATATNLGQPGSDSVCFGPDKKLYFGAKKDSFIHRLTTPEGKTQLVETVATLAATHPGATVGRGSFEMNFQSSDLYVNVANDLQRVVAASVLCNGGCLAEDLNLNIAAVGSNRSNTVYFATQGVSLPPTQLSELVNQYDLTSKTTQQLSAGGVFGSQLFYAAVLQFTVNAQTQAVFVLDDVNPAAADAGAVANSGRVLMIASTVTVGRPITSTAPATEGLAPFIAPIAPSAPPVVPGRSATQIGNNGGLTAPGVLFINGDIWVLDAAQGVCKGNGGKIDPKTCVAAGIPGQSAYDAVNQFVYVPDKSPNSVGVWRFPYDPSRKTITAAAGVLVAPNKGLGGNQPQCASLGPDGNLYVSFVKNGSVLQITAPNTNTNTITQVAQSSDGHGIKSLAWITRHVVDGFGTALTFNDLYMLESNALTYSVGAIAGTKSKGNLLTTASIINPSLMTSDGADTIYIANGGEVDRYIASTSNQSVWTIGGGAPIVIFGSITGLSLDPANSLLWIGDDVSGTAAPGQGRLWQVSTK